MSAMATKRSSRFNISPDKENNAGAPVNAAKGTAAIAGRVKSTQSRKPFSNVGNTIQGRKQPALLKKLSNVEKTETVARKDSPSCSEIENVSPFNEPEGQVKSETHGRKPFSSVGNTIQDRKQPTSSKEDTKPMLKVSKKSSNERLAVPRKEAQSCPEVELVTLFDEPTDNEDISTAEKQTSMSLSSLEIEEMCEAVAESWPEIEHMPSYSEPEDDYEDIWPREERLSHDDLVSLKYLHYYKPISHVSPPSSPPTEPVEFLPIYEMLDDLEDSYDSLHPVPLDDYQYPVPSP